VTVLPVPPVMFQAKLAMPVALVMSRTVDGDGVVLPDAVGVPEIRPVGGVDRQPGGQARSRSRTASAPPAESVAWTCRLAAVPTVPACVPGLVTDTLVFVVPLVRVGVVQFRHCARFALLQTTRSGTRLGPSPNSPGNGP